MNQKISVYGAILKEGKLLVLHRKKPDVWELPGGRIEYGEHPIETAIREVKEETNLDVEVIEKPIIGSIVRPDGMHELVITYPCKPLNEDLKLSFEHFEHRWVNYNELKELQPIATSLLSVTRGLKKWVK